MAGWRRWHLRRISSILIISAALIPLLHGLQSNNNETILELVPAGAPSERDTSYRKPSSISSRIPCISGGISAAISNCGARCKQLGPSLTISRTCLHTGCCIGADSTHTNGYCYCCHSGPCGSVSRVCPPATSTSDCVALTYAIYPCSDQQYLPTEDCKN